MKLLILVSAFLVFVVTAPVRVALADTGRGAGIMLANGTHEEEHMRDDCNDLIRIFDQTRTDNAEAKRLRQEAEQNCADASQTDVYRGWDQIRQALTMINAY